jgi:transposase
LQDLVLKLIAELESTKDQLGLAIKRIEELESDNKELKARLAATSNNSNRPPSSDGLRKRPGLPKAKPKKRGGQTGHKGNTLKMIATPDFVVELSPTVCSCGSSLESVPKVCESTRQVFDLPVPQLEVTAYQQLSCSCPGCGKKHLGVFPKGVAPNAQYGSGVRALVTMLSIEHKLPFKKIRLLFEDLFGYSLNESTQLKALDKCDQSLGDLEPVIKAQLLKSQVVHFDETGLRVEAKLHWLHVASNDFFTHLFVDKHRGKKAIQGPESILPEYSGWAIHDCWASYFNLDHCRHGICGSHLLRELQGLIDRGSNWAVEMHKLLLDLYKQTDKGKSKLADLTQATRRYKYLCKKADTEEPLPIINPRGRPTKTKGRNLMDRLLKHREAVLAFATYEQVPFTNNQAERDLRHAKIKQKIAGSFRTKNGADCYARISGFISTLRKHKLKQPERKINIFQELKTVFEGGKFDFNPQKG